MNGSLPRGRLQVRILPGSPKNLKNMAYLQGFVQERAETPVSFRVESC